MFFILIMCFASVYSSEKDRLAVMDVTDETGMLDEKAIINVTDYIFTKFQGTGLFWMIPKSDRDTALDKAIEETKLSSRKECVDEKCQLSLVAELQANFLINTKIKKLYENTCQISISKFDVEKRAGVFSWEEKFNCTGKAVFEAIDGMNLSGKKSGTFKEGKIGETVEDWEVGTGEETIVKFESDPSEAVVMADGRIICQKTPCSKQLATGKHEIVIQKENYLPKSKIFEIKKGLSVKEELEPDFGWLNITGKYTVELKLDGEIIGNIPIEKKIINPGAHEIEHTNSCYYQSGEKFTIKRGETKEITIELNPKESAIKVSAKDSSGNDVEATVFVDGKEIGTAPGTFKVPVCSKEVVVKNSKEGFKKELALEEKEVLSIDAILKVSIGWSERTPEPMTWLSAKNYCENLVEDGFDDWRLPTISELRTLLGGCPKTETGGKCEVMDSCLSYLCRNNICDGCPNSQDGKYSKFGDADGLWSSSSLSDSLGDAWLVYFGNGGLYSKDKDIKLANVRCVRGKIIEKDSATEKKKNINVTKYSKSKVVDNWSKRSAKQMGWLAAKEYCEKLVENDFDDWRLPTISELRSLIQNCPATETGGVCKVSDSCLSQKCRDLFDCGGCKDASSKLGDTYTFWSASEFSDNEFRVWCVDFYEGRVPENCNKVRNIENVRCVRKNKN